MNLDEFQTAVDDLGEGFESFRAEHKAELGKLREELAAERRFREDVERRLNLAKVNGGGSAREPLVASAPVFYDTKAKKLLPGLSHKQRLSDQPGYSSPHVGPTTLGRMLRYMCIGARCDDYRELQEEAKSLSINVDPQGGYLIPDQTASWWIDLLRSRLVLSQAGAVTVPMASRDMSIAKLTADPTPQWHAENAALTASEPTFGAVTLTARTIACPVKFSVELSQDASNLQDILQTTLTAALSHGIDSAGLNGTSTDSAGAPGGIFNLSGRQVTSSIGSLANWDPVIKGYYNLLNVNVPATAITMIAHPRFYLTMDLLKSGITGDERPLSAWLPDTIRQLPRLDTTAVPVAAGPTSKCVVGAFGDYLMGVRSQISVRVLQERYLADSLSLAVVAFARVAFVATRAASFQTLEGVTVT